MAKHYMETVQEKSIYARSRVELFLDEEESSLGDENPLVKSPSGK